MKEKKNQNAHVRTTLCLFIEKCHILTSLDISMTSTFLFEITQFSSKISSLSTFQYEFANLHE